MASLYLSSVIDAAADAVFTWHTRPGALERQLPPWSGMRVERQPPNGVQDGSHITLRMPVGPLRLPWVAVYYGVVAGRQYCDEQLEGPFNSWHHTHRMLPVPNATGCTLEDDVRYEVSWPVRLMAGGEARIQRLMRDVFNFRHQRARADVSRHLRFAQHGTLRIAVTGASGLLGRRLVPFLRSGGHTVLRLVRSGADKSRDAVRWDPESGALDIERLGDVDAVIHLAGESLASGRWSAKRKAAIRDSRVLATRELCASLAHLAKPPKVFISASAVGYYGDRRNGAVSESDGPGKGFLAEVCEAWEGAAAPLRNSGTRIVQLRMGMVVAGEGGALPRMLRPFRWGLGGRLGSGNQGMPWIAAEDALGVIHQALFDARMIGPVNAVAPHPTSNREFTGALAKALNRMAMLPVPGFVLRLALGEMGQALLLEGALVRPAKLQALAFPFLFTDLEAAIRFELGREAS